MKLAVICLAICCCFAVMILARKSNQKTNNKQKFEAMERKKHKKNIAKRMLGKSQTTKRNTNKNSNIKWKGRKRKNRKNKNKNKNKTSGKRTLSKKNKKKQNLYKRKRRNRKGNKNGKKMLKANAKTKTKSRKNKMKRNKGKSKSKNKGKINTKGKRTKQPNKEKKNRGKGMKNKFSKGKPISIKDIYSYTKGKPQKNHLEYTFASEDRAINTGIMFPALNFTEGIIEEIKIIEELGDNTTLKTIIRAGDKTKNIAVIRSFIVIVKTGPRADQWDHIINEYDIVDLTRCYDKSRDCVASIKQNMFGKFLVPQSNCLKDAFPRVPGRILESSIFTKNGVLCEYWNTTANYFYGRYVDEYENRCTNKAKLHRDSSTPHSCFAEGRMQECFQLCNPDHTKMAVLNADNPEIHLLLENETNLILTFQSPNGTVLVTEKGKNSNPEQAFYRCYNATSKCVAKVGGPCLYEIYTEKRDTTLATILRNANRTVTNKPCVSWVDTFYGQKNNNPDHNLCSMHSNLPCNNARGPWCAIHQGWEPCFQLCDDFFSYYRPIKPPRYIDLKQYKVEEIIVSGQLKCGPWNYREQKVTFLQRNRLNYSEDATDFCGYAYTDRYGKFNFRLICQCLYFDFSNTAIQIKKCCKVPTACYRFTKQAHVTTNLTTGKWHFDFGTIELGKHPY